MAAAPQYKIELGVPIARIAGKPGAGRKPVYPFAAMAIGDSFFAANKTSKAAASAHAKKHGVKFVSRSVEGGFRIWRVA